MKLILSLLLPFIFAFHIVPDDGGGSDLEPEAQPEAEPNPADGEPETAADAVLEDLGLDEAAPAAEEKQEGEPEAAGSQEAPADKGRVELTDEDLAPLNSRNVATNERFHKLTEGFKQERQEKEAAQSQAKQYEQSFDSLRSLGFSDENAAHDLVEFSTYRHALYTGDADAFNQIIANQVKQFEAIHGKRVAITASALDDYPDLKQKVDDLDMDEADALAVARARNLQNRAERGRADQDAVARNTEQVQVQIDQATDDIYSLEANWRKTDPDYAEVIQHIDLAAIGQKYPPAMWAQTLQLQYANIKKAMVSTVSSRSTERPLRGSGHQSGKPAPASAAEAVLQDLELA